MTNKNGVCNELNKSEKINYNRTFFYIFIVSRIAFTPSILCKEIKVFKEHGDHELRNALSDTPLPPKFLI